MIFKNKLLILFIILNFIYIVKSATYLDVPKDEYDCVDKFVTKFNLVKTFPKTDGEYKGLCASGGSTTCYINGSISEFLANAVTETINTDVQVEISDLTCFPFLKLYYVQRIPINQNLLYYPFPYLTRYSVIDMPIQEINKTFPKLSYVFISPSNYPTFSLKLSYFNNVQALQYSGQYITLEVDDAAHGLNLNYLSIYSNNFPNFSKYSFSTLTINLNTGFNIQEFYNNFQYVSAYDVYLNFMINYSTKTYPEVPFFLHTNFKITYFSFSGSFTAADKIYDMRANINYKIIKIGSSVTGNFYYQNKFPLIVSSDTNLFYFGSKNDSVSVNIDPSLTAPNKFISIDSYSYSGLLPKYNGSGAGYAFSNHKRLSGTIDSSWCGTNLIVQNNNLSGSIPSCFTCYFAETSSFIKQAGAITNSYSVPAMYNRFSGNSFTNYVKNTPCTTYKPQVKYYNSTAFIIYGQDIGFQLENYYLNSSTSIACLGTSEASVIRLGYEYMCAIQGNYNIAQVSYFTLTNSVLKTTYTMALKSLQPTFTSIKIVNNKVTIAGNCFSSYVGQSIQNVTIDSDIDCVITDGSFTNVICTVPVTLPDTKQLIVLRNENQLRRVYAVFKNNTINDKICYNDCLDSSGGRICNMYTGLCEDCPNSCSGHGTCDQSTSTCQCSQGYTLDDCSGLQCPIVNGLVCSNQGTCNTATGVCQCDSTHSGNACQYDSIPCPTNNDLTCNNQGTCDTATGLCKCDSSHQGSSCSTPFIQCPIDNGELCSGFGSCNNQTGVCTCDSSYQSSDCSLPYIQCPIVNNKVCSGSGSCNNQTGVCTCDSSHQSSDCSLPFIQCPIANNKVCSGSGSCNNQTGVCTCDSSHQSSDCSLPLVECPIVNNKVCSGSGLCNNQTGVCTCDSSHQGSSCLTPFIQCPVVNNELCSGFGSCNNQTGVCTCDSSHQSSDCNVPFIECYAKCLNQGLCNNVTGICSCNEGYSGNYCQKFEHYVTSVSPSYENGNQGASFFGNFGKIHEDISVQIDQKVCSIIYVSDNIISCASPSGKGIQSINITQNGFSFIGKNIYQFIKLESDIIECPNSCSNNGDCNKDGTCSCFTGFKSFDCSSSSNETSPTSVTVNQESASINIDINNINLNFNLVTLNEVTLDNQIVNSIPLNKNWVLGDSIASGQYKFTQTPSNSDGDEFTITYSIIKQENTQDYMVSVSIKNYKYQSVLNILQLELVSTLNTLDNIPQDCNTKDISLDTTYLNNQYQNNYMKLSKNNINFIGSFNTQIVSDSRSTFLPSSYSSDSNSISLILNLLHCVEECIYEFSEISLSLDSNYVNSCEDSQSSSSQSSKSQSSSSQSSTSQSSTSQSSESQNNQPNKIIDSGNSWKLPVGVSVGVAGGVACIGALAYKFKDRLFKSKNIGSISMDQRNF